MTTENANLEVSSLNVHQDLIDACRKFDQKAQFKIYKLYYKAMYNISLRIVNNTMEAEDIMQEAFLSAFEEIDKYSGKDKLWRMAEKYCAKQVNRQPEENRQDII